MTLARVVTPTEIALEVIGALMGYASPTVAEIEEAHFYSMGSVQSERLRSLSSLEFLLLR